MEGLHGELLIAATTMYVWNVGDGMRRWEISPEDEGNGRSACDVWPDLIQSFLSICRDPFLQLPGLLSRICCSDWLNGVTVEWIGLDHD